MFGRIRARNPKLKKETRIPMIGKGKKRKVIMFQRTRLEFQGVQG